MQALTEVKHIQNFEIDEIPSWQACLNNLNETDDFRYGNVGFFVSYHTHKIPEVKRVLERLGLHTAHTYMNVTTQNYGGLGRHNDTMDVWYWQCQGITSWTFDDAVYVLQPGDLITIPKGVYHEVIPLTPRLGVSMGVT